MNSLRNLFRWMLLGWLILVIFMSAIVAHSTDSAAPGNLLAFLFTRTETSVPLPPLSITPPREPMTSEPVPVPPPAAPLPAEWTPLEQGRQAGKGVLGDPEVRVLGDGSLEVRLACAGTPGDFTVYHPGNVPSLSVDLQGNWSRSILFDRKLAESCLSRVQIAKHPKWVRVSGVARDGKRGLFASVEHSAKAGIIRIIFSAGQ